METPDQTVKLLDYKQVKASSKFVPQAPKLASLGWNELHLELHQQPEFETAEHQHNMHVIALCLSSSPGERRLDGRIQTERRGLGDIAIIPAGVAHRCNWNNLAEFGILAVDPTLLQKVGRDLVDSDRISLIPQFMNESDELLKGIFISLKDELESRKIGSSLLIDSLKTTLAIHLLRQYCSTKPKLPNYGNSLSKAKLKQVIEYINENLGDELKVIELAAIVQISPYHFIRLFKKALGKTPHQYILQQRIEKAKCLLEYREISLAEIATLVGFSDQSHFSKYFKRVIGITPKQYLTQSQ